MYEPDLEAIKRIRNGDHNSFAGIAERYKDKAFSLIIKIIKNREEAEDVLQDSFLKIFRAIIENKFEGKSKFSTYIYSIVYNTAIDCYKKNKTLNEGLTSFDTFYIDDESFDIQIENRLDHNLYEESTHFNAAKLMDENEIKGIINKYLKLLPENYAVILTMYYINELSYSEISSLINLPSGTVKNRLFRAKEKLKDLILKNYTIDSILDYVA
jgi:RNA polymerase sigma-70 factor (ECF subfamily)